MRTKEGRACEAHSDMGPLKRNMRGEAQEKGPVRAATEANEVS